MYSLSELADQNKVLYIINDLQEMIKKGRKPDYIVMNKHTYYLVLSLSLIFTPDIKSQIRPGSFFGVPIVVKIEGEETADFLYEPLFKN